MTVGSKNQDGAHGRASHGHLETLGGASLGAHLRRLAEGDEESLAAVYDETCASVYGLCLRVLGDVTSAEMVTAETYSEICRHSGGWADSGMSACSWILSLAHRRAVTQLRTRGSRRPVAGFRRSAPGPSRGVGPSLGSAILEMAYFGGCSRTEVAALLAVSVDEVDEHLRISLVALKS